MTRAVVVATLLSAFVQGLLAGLGFYVAGVGSVFLLTALSMLLTLVPFVGAAIVWVPVCLWLYAMEGRTAAAAFWRSIASRSSRWWTTWSNRWCCTADRIFTRCWRC